MQISARMPALPGPLTIIPITQSLSHQITSSLHTIKYETVFSDPCLFRLLAMRVNSWEIIFYTPGSPSVLSRLLFFHASQTFHAPQAPHHPGTRAPLHPGPRTPLLPPTRAPCTPAPVPPRSPAPRQPPGHPVDEIIHSVLYNGDQSSLPWRQETLMPFVVVHEPSISPGRS